MKLQINIILCLFVTLFPRIMFSSEDSGDLNQMARAEWVKGFQKLEEAEYSEEFGNYQKAVDLLKEAKKIFESVKGLYKQWNQSLLNFRIKYCEQKIKRLESLNLATTKNKKEQGLEEPSRNHIADENALLRQRNHELESDISILADKLAVLSKEGSQRRQFMIQGESSQDSSRDLEQLNRINEDLKKSNQDFKNQITDLNNQLGLLKNELQAKEEHIKQTTLENQSNQGEYKTQLAETRSELEAAEKFNRQLTERLANLQKLESDNEQLQKSKQNSEIEIQDLRNKIHDLESERENRLTEAGKEDEELEKLKAELQEQAERVTQLSSYLQNKEKMIEELKEENQATTQNYKKQLEEARSELALAKEEKEKLTDRVSDLQKIELDNKQLQEANQSSEKSQTIDQNYQDQAEEIHSQLVLAQEANQRLTEQMEQVTAELDSRIKAQEASELKRKEEVGEVIKLQKLVEIQREKKEEYKDKFSENNAELKKTRELNQKLETDLEKLNVNYGQKDRELKEAEKELQKYHQEIEKEHASLKKEQLKTEKYKKELSEVRSELESSQASNDRLKNQVKEIKERLTETTQKMEELQSNLGIQESKVLELKRFLEKEKTEKGDYKSQFFSLKSEFEAVKNSEQQVQDMIHEPSADLKASQRRQKELEQNLSELQKKYDEVKENESKLRENYDSNLALVQSLKSEVHVLKRQLPSNRDNKTNIKKLAANSNDAQELDEWLSQNDYSGTAGVTNVSNSSLGEKLKDYELTITELNEELLAKDIAVTQKDQIIEDMSQKIAELRGTSEPTKNLSHKITELSDSSKSTKNISEKLPVTKKTGDKGNWEVADIDLSRTKLPSQSTPKVNEETPLNGRMDALLSQASREKESGNNREAIATYHKVLDNKPDDPTALFELAKLLVEIKDFNNAERYLTKAFYQETNDPEVASLLGTTLIETDKADRAAAILRQAIEIHPNSANLHQTLGLALLNIGKTESAETELKLSFSLDDTSADTAYKLAVLYAGWTPPRLEDAKDWYTKAKNLGIESDSSLENVLND